MAGWSQGLLAASIGKEERNIVLVSKYWVNSVLATTRHGKRIAHFVLESKRYMVDQINEDAREATWLLQSLAA